MPSAPKRFVKALLASGLVSAADLRAFERKLTTGQRPPDAETLARALVRARKLTRYQAAMLYHGQSNRLVLGNYTILDKIGAGGMGQVFKAVHRRMDRLVALKLLPPEAARSRAAVERFRREVRAAAKLSHPHIVAAYDADEADGIDFLVMEYVDGPNLAEMLKRNGPLPLDQAVSCVMQAALGLAYAHAHGVIHRDVKPANLLVDPAGQVKVLDLGLARMRSATAENRSAGLRSLTASGEVVGTVEYMSPEQAEDTRLADERSDIYALGCTLFRLLTGELPYPGETAIKIILAHRQQPVPSLGEWRHDVPAAVDAVFRKMAAKNASDRYQSMREVITAFQKLGFDGSAGGATIQDGAAPHDDRPPDSGANQIAGPHSSGECKSSSHQAESAGMGAFRRLAVLAACAAAMGALMLALSDRMETTSPEPAATRAGSSAAGRPSDNIRARQRVWAESLKLPVATTNSIGIALALVPPGEFQMGTGPADAALLSGALALAGATPATWQDKLADEVPQHAVRISRPFYISVLEVTVGQFARFVAETGYVTDAEAGAPSESDGRLTGHDWRNPQGFTQTENHPVVHVSWHDAAEFCQWLSQREDAEYQLPSEAQWEYACRAGNRSPWFLGDDASALSRFAWFHENAANRTHQVGLLDANALNLHDIYGNVSEWCRDGPRTYSEHPASDPLGPGDGSVVLRGGSWASPSSWHVRSALRVRCDSRAASSATTGFRVVRTVGKR